MIHDDGSNNLLSLFHSSILISKMFRLLSREKENWFRPIDSTFNIRSLSLSLYWFSIYLYCIQIWMIHSFIPSFVDFISFFFHWLIFNSFFFVFIIRVIYLICFSPSSFSVYMCVCVSMCDLYACQTRKPKQKFIFGILKRLPISTKNNWISVLLVFHFVRFGW